uniref:NR LBD domain-containing protein n=1 Tax=Heterorhabditis bacteriophora TaxID=37862 RepID=A0A1I7WV05_HETBA
MSYLWCYSFKHYSDFSSPSPEGTDAIKFFMSRNYLSRKLILVPYKIIKLYCTWNDIDVVDLSVIDENKNFDYFFIINFFSNLLLVWSFTCLNKMSDSFMPSGGGLRYAAWHPLLVRTLNKCLIDGVPHTSGHLPSILAILASLPITKGKLGLKTIY